jgi:hypothetical protein
MITVPSMHESATSISLLQFPHFAIGIFSFLLPLFIFTLIFSIVALHFIDANG